MSFFSSFYFFGFIVSLFLVLHLLFKNPKPLLNKLCALFLSCLGAWSFVNIHIHTPHMSGEAAAILAAVGLFAFIWASGLVYAAAGHKFPGMTPVPTTGNIPGQERNETINDVLLNISEAALRAVTLRELLEIIQQQVNRLMDARNFYAALVYDREQALYTFPFIVDINPGELEDPDTPVELKRSFTDYVMRTEKPLLADKKTYDDLLLREDIRLIGEKPVSWMGVPLKTPEDGMIGVVVIQSYFDESAYSQGDMHVLSIISNTIAGAVKYKQAEEALRQSEEHYRTLIDNIQDGVFLLYKGKWEFVNDAFARMVGYTADQVMKMEFEDLVSPGDLDMVAGRYWKRLQGENVPAEYEFRLRHKNGTHVFVNVHVGLVNYKDGMASLGTLKDITGRELAEREKKELEEKLARSEKMETVGRLAGGVAHDLNNVLSAIVSYPDYLLMKLPGDSPLKKSVMTIKQSGLKAAAIVQDLLTLARRGVSIKETRNLNDIVSEYLDSPEFEKLVKYHPNVRVNTQFEEDLLNIRGSTLHIAKTLMNLTANSAEAMPPGGEILITTENRYINTPRKGYYQTVERGEYVVLTVTDTGTGIAREDLDKIFEPFYTKKAMGRSGTGLGMAVVWGTLEDHKGFIDVMSTEGKGTTFELYFPVTRENGFNREADTSINEYRGNGETILVVDDQPDQREIAAVLLNELGYIVHTVSSGEEAVEHIKTKTVSADLLLLDMLMGTGIDGLDTYKEIQKLQPGTKAIIISGFSESDRVKGALEIGAGAYIKKPYTMKKIGTAVRKELDRS
jgi:PAS domain S-box-containing protein